MKEAPFSIVTEPSMSVERRAFTKVAWRFTPVLTLAYIFTYLDRNNVSFAALQMNRAVGLTATQFGTGAGILFLSYCLVGLPSNVALYRVGARIWLSAITIACGLVSMATIFVAGPKSWYFLRFLLGVAEAGFFPGATFFLATWFPREYRTRILAWFLAAIPGSAAIGAPISGLLLGIKGVAGLSGWQCLFLLEGLPVVLLGIALIWALADGPEHVNWLTEEERQIVRERTQGERRDREVQRLLPALKDVRVVILAFVELGFVAGAYGVGIWLPQIIKTARFSDLQVGFLTGGCYLCATVGMIAWAAHVDKRGKSVLHLVLTCAIAAAGFVLAVLATNFWLSLVWITVALIGTTAARGIFWAIPPRFLTGLAAAGGLAYINSVGTIGGFVGPFVIGWLKDRTGMFSAGMWAMAAVLLASTIGASFLKYFLPDEPVSLTS